MSLLRCSVLLAGLAIAHGAGAVVVNGTVTLLEDGTPAAGAIVRLVRITGPSTTELVAETIIDGTATYSFSAPGVFGNFRLDVSLSEEYVPMAAPFSAQDESPVVRNFALSYPSQLLARVREAATQQPIVGTTVWFIDQFDVLRSVITNAQGNAPLVNVAGGRYRVCAVNNDDVFRNECFDNQHLQANNAVGGIAPVELGSYDVLELTIDLDPGASIEGTLRDRYFNVPIGGNMNFQLYDNAGAPLLQVTRSVPLNGAYSLAGLPGGVYLLAVSSGQRYYTPRVYPDVDCAPTCTITNGTPIAVPDGALVAGIDFDLHPGGVALGTVTNAADSTPLSGVRVAAFEEGSQGWAEVTRASTNASGAFTLAHLRPGTLRFGTLGRTSHINESWPNLPCYVAELCADGTSVAFGVDQVSTGLDFALDAGASIQGSLRRQGTGQLLSGSLLVRTADSSIVATFSATSLFPTFGSPGLPPGTYYAAARESFALPSACEVYAELPCATLDPGLDPIDPSVATPIVVTGPGVVGGVDFTIAEDFVFASSFEGVP